MTLENDVVSVSGNTEQYRVALDRTGKTSFCILLFNDLLHGCSPEHYQY